MEQKRDTISEAIGSLVVGIAVIVLMALMMGIVAEQLFNWFVFPYTDIFVGLESAGWVAFVGLGMTGRALLGMSGSPTPIDTSEETLFEWGLKRLWDPFIMSVCILVIGKILVGFLPPIG